MSPSGVEPVTFRLIAQCLMQLRPCLAQSIFSVCPGHVIISAHTNISANQCLTIVEVSGRGKVVSVNRITHTHTHTHTQSIQSTFTLLKCFTKTLGGGSTLLRGLSLRANYTTERPPPVGEVSANFCG